MKKLFVFFSLFIPSVLLASGRKDTRTDYIYEYLSGIKGMAVEISDSCPCYYNNNFHLGYYNQFGAELYGNYYNSYYEEYLKDVRVINLIDKLDGYVSGRQFIVYEDGFYIDWGTGPVRYSLLNGEIEKRIPLENDDSHYLSKTAGLYFSYKKDTDEITIIDLNTLSVVAKCFTGTEFEKTGIDEWSDYSETQILMQTIDSKICLYDFFTGQKRELLDLTPVIPGERDMHIGLSSLHTLDNGHIQFVFLYHGTYYLCEYMVPEVFRS